MGDRKHQAKARWHWETCFHGEVNHERSMGSLTTGSPENILDSETALRRPEGLRFEV